MNWLNPSNIYEYIENHYGKIVSYSQQTIPNISSLSQKVYEGEMDCTLTSLTTICKFYNPQINTTACYNNIKLIAQQYLYTDNKGTNPFFINKIANKIFAFYQIPLSSKAKYLKGIKWNISFIKNCINNNQPLILSMKNDGHNYYKNHSVVCKGYIDFITNNNNKHHYLLEVYDNWHKTSSFIDYEKLSKISSINYFIN